MRRKITRLVLCALLFADSYQAQAQEPTKVPRIAYLTGSSPPTIATPDLNAYAFQQGLRDLGYIEGKNIQVEYRYLEGKEDRNPTLLAELLQLKVDVIVVISMPSIRAAKQATRRFRLSW